jgi:predicted secreted Zn-dependent protease
MHPLWSKSTFSESGNCVEVAVVAEAVLVRQSRDPSGPTLTFTKGEWAAFLAGVRNEEFDSASSGGH